MSDQRRWTDKPNIDLADVSDEDLLLLADMSEASGTRDRTLTILALRAWLTTGATLWGTITGDLSDQSDLWAALQAAQIWPVKSISLSSGNYNVTVGDEFSIMTFSAGGFSNPPNRRIILPAHSTVAFPVGTRFQVIRLDDDQDEGAAIVNFDGASGVTVRNSSGSLVQFRQYEALKIDEDDWVISS